MDNVTIIGIAGGTGSGKTTLAQYIVNHFPNEVSILTHDEYYLPQDELTYEERKELNYDHPNAFDTDLLVEHLKMLKSGKSVDRPCYDFSIYNRTDKTERINPARVIIVEGILIFCEPELRKQMDMKIFVDTDADVRILRRLQRDVEERGRTIESIVHQYLTTVKPMHEQFVEPSKKYADIIVPSGGQNPVALSMICEQIRTLLGQ